jgi:hypothetical protein
MSKNNNNDSTFVSNDKPVVLKIKEYAFLDNELVINSIDTVTIFRNGKVIVEHQEKTCWSLTTYG